MRKLAFLIAVDQYEDADISPLRFAAADVRALGRTLRERCGFDLVKSLDGGPDSLRATKGNVLTALKAFTGEVRPEDLLLFYFSGHGIEVNDGGYLLMADSFEAYPDHTGLSLALLRASLERMSAAHRVLMFDSCRNDPRKGKGSAANYMGEALGRDLVAAARAMPTGGNSGGTVTALLAACRTGQRAYELTDKQHGVFTHYLLEGLSGAAWPAGSDALEFRHVAHYAYREVTRWSAATQSPDTAQQPWYEEFGSGEPIVLARRAATVAAPAIAAFSRHELIVSSDGSGQYRSIGEAIRAARPGALIRVLPGVYREGLVIDKPVEIVGEGPVEWIVVESDSASCLISTAHAATVRGLTLRSAAATKGLQFYAADIQQGRILLEGCDMTSDSASCVAVHGALADPLVRKCTLHHAKHSGVIVYEKGRGVFEDCDIFGHAMQCVTVQSGGDPTMRRCKIRDGLGNGVYVNDKGKGVFEDCDIFGHAMACVVIITDGDPMLRRCKIRDGKGNGVFVKDQGKGTFEDCEVFAHPNLCLTTDTGGDPMLRRCKIHDSPGTGVYIDNQGKGTLEDCDIFNHAKRCLLTMTNGDPTLRRCKIRDSQGNGFDARNQGKGILEDCDIFGHALPCVAVSDGGDPILRRCKIHDSKSCGIYVFKSGRGTFEKCEFWGNKTGNFNIGDGCNPVRNGNIER